MESNKVKKLKAKNDNNFSQLQCEICGKRMKPMEIWKPYKNGFAHSSCIKK